jgi:Na+-translocating ferredoxin:NAD+ oxidoreductase subunit B
MHSDTLLIEAINQLLPQTQCGQCGYAGCKPYATAISEQQADINQCPPGGDEGIAQLAAFLGRPSLPLNPKFGVIKPKSVARIDEETCIGCVKCIQACPVDAIVGASKLMHTVIAAECTGCELCIAPCPVDCISMHPLPQQPSLLQKQQLATLAKNRYEYRLTRFAQAEQAKQERANRQKALLAKLKLK